MATQSQVIEPITPITTLTYGAVRPYAAPDQNPARVYIAAQAKSAQSTTRSAVNRIAELMSGGLLDLDSMRWESLRYQHLMALRANLAEQWKTATVNRYVSTVKGIVRECWRLGLMDHESFAKAMQVKQLRRVALPVGRIVTSDEVRHIVDVLRADRSIAAVRNLAMILVCYGCGPRRAEVVGLNVEDYDAEQRTLRVRHGKGNKERILHVPKGTAQSLAAWLLVRSTEPGPLFCATHRWQRVLCHSALAKDNLNSTFDRIAKRANIKRFTPHDLRRSYITGLLRLGVDLNTVRHLAGHAHIQTTTCYDIRPDLERRQAAEVWEVPW